ncbi:LRR receptor-like serine/threonine-protein [Vigna angularis]|uniref:non-specific serine/threonine protein kinase n=1 Tax=Phaseolus angularis TaxID=3914 RepID=A0A8T0JIN7_PHAAN|nr:LRR receptor-like serine/threonine-protein [Vigna angularis]
MLKTQNLSGTLPPELTGLPHLEEIDLTRNYLNGTIPVAWGSSKLRIISLLGNRLTGPIPKEIGNITTLESLVLEFNQFTGNITSDLGNLSNLERLHLTSNNFTGELPETLAKLTSLRELRLNDNNFSGRIPSFIQRWTNLEILEIQGSGLSGPIPSEISFLHNLDDLRITDLTNGSDSTFPQINMTKLETLDLSYNNFTYKNSEACQETEGKMNLFESFPMSPRGAVTCLPSGNCTRTFDYFHINCGGEQVKSSEGILYDENSDPSGAATSKKIYENWAFSNTGHFLDANTNAEVYIQKSQNTLSMTDSALYQTARVSPISLTYYGMCLENGEYTVSLHFAEIMFTDDNTYSSLGRRIFDVYIQEKLELKDFNIANEAGGVGKNITKRISTTVSNGTLNIRFYWAGKGTTAIPYKSVYGPLISAISATRVNSSSKGPRDMAIGVVIGIAVSAIIFVILVVLAWRLHIGKRNSLTKVKMLSSKSKQGNREFINEIGLISALQHPCLVKLYGCCVEGNQLLLAHILKEKGNLMELIDRRLGTNFNEKEVMMMIKVGLLCTNATANLRPTMSSILSMLEGKTVIPEFVSDSSEVMDEKKQEAMRQYYSQMEENESNETHRYDSSSKDGPWTASSSSAADLYPVHTDSSYWEKRN